MSVHFSLKQKISEAELLVIGVGGEFEAGFDVLEKTSIYNSFINKIKSESLCEADYEWMYPLMLSEGLKESHIAKDYKKAYLKLKELINDKNYYIVSMNMDSLLEECGFDKDRIVQPCGSYLKLQCEYNCHETIYDGRNYARAVCELISDETVKLFDIQQEICDKCNNHLISNTINAFKYNENGYLGNWNVYQKYLMGTLNKKVLLLELGMTDEFPEIVINPFKKICSLNNKSYLYSISLRNQNFGNELADKVTQIFENAVCYLNRI